jgi:hypothetical protein
MLSPELLSRWQDFPDITKKGILVGISAGIKPGRKSEEYHECMSSLPEEALNWLIDFWESHLDDTEKPIHLRSPRVKK